MQITLLIMQGIGKVVLVGENGSTFTLAYVLYVLGIKINLLPVFGCAKIGLVMKFMDDNCIVYDLNNGDIIIAFCLL